MDNGSASGRVGPAGSTVVVLDLGTKALASRTGRGGPVVPLSNPDFSLGLASAPHLAMLTLMLGLLGLAWCATWPRVSAGECPVWVAGALIGGAAANLLDRAASGAVHDFLVVGPVVLNVADLAVLAGVIGCYRVVAASRRTAVSSG